MSVANSGGLKTWTTRLGAGSSSVVVGTGVDPVTYRFSGGRSAN